MIEVRAVTPGDRGAIAELLARVTPGGPDVERIEEELERIFFEPPWRDPACPSLLATDATGKVQAFLGVIPRPMTLGDRAVSAAVAARLTIHRDCRELVGLHLLQRFLEGPQELSLMDGARCATRVFWERLGGVAGLLYNLSWTRPLRPARWALARLRPQLGPAVALGRPLARLVDGVIACSAASPFRLPPKRPAMRDVTDEALRACMDEVAGARLRARYDRATLGWLLARAEARAAAPLRRVVVEAGRDRHAGWFVTTTPRDGVAQVVQMGARVGAEDAVLSAILLRTAAEGCVAVAGRVHPRFTNDLSDRGALLHATGTLTLVHSRDDAIIRHIERGDALLGRLDGEWWLSFERGGPTT